MNDQPLFLYHAVMMISLVMLGSFGTVKYILGSVFMFGIAAYTYYKFFQGIKLQTQNKVCPMPQVTK